MSIYTYDHAINKIIYLNRILKKLYIFINNVIIYRIMNKLYHNTSKLKVWSLPRLSITFLSVEFQFKLTFKLELILSY